MPYPATHKAETRRRIVASARKLFNRHGFNAVSIDEIMADAGLTRGGFYKHFGAKEELYRAAVLQFAHAEKPEYWQSRHVDPSANGVPLARMIVNSYLSKDHFDDRDGSCPMIALPSDVARSADLHHESVGARYLSDLFPPEVTSPIALHVRAKRYLCTVDPAYGRALSDGSRHSLERQGGALDPERVAAFEALDGFEAAVALRRWDDGGKVEDLAVPPLDTYVPMLERLAPGSAA